MVCARPRPAAMPTQELPTTVSTCASTRSRNESWRLRWCSSPGTGSVLSPKEVMVFRVAQAGRLRVANQASRAVRAAARFSADAGRRLAVPE